MPHDESKDASNAQSFNPSIRGRGSVEKPSGRFERFNKETDAETFNALYEAGWEEHEKQIPTETFRDMSRTIITTNDSPDIGMETTLNPYRGCEHGCIYCYARPTHEYLGLSAGTDFESKIYVKEDAPALLRKKLQSRTWVPKVIALSGITDPYQPLERKLRITRGFFEVLRDFANPAVVITKNHLVTRDIDIFQDMVKTNTVKINLSVTTLDTKLARHMEPRTSTPSMRLKAIEALAKENIPVGIMMGPIVPGLTDHEIPSLLKAVAEAGAQTANYTMLRLPYGVKDIFQTWLKQNYPDRTNKVLNRLREMRGGKLYDSKFGNRMRGEGVYAEQIGQIFKLYKGRYGLNRSTSLSTQNFNPHAADDQLSLF